jgi:16S rRNA (guanine966-N2)-methyltransferase
VIAGSARGRRLLAPEGTEVRPTAGRVREAMFSALVSRGAVLDANVLDLYAGTGALAIEALSRGAERAVLVERSRAALKAIDANLETLGFDDRARVEARSVETFLTQPPREAPFDLVLCDPPYEGDVAQLRGVLTTLGAGEWLTDDAIVVVECAYRSPVEPPDTLEVGWERTFGDTLVTFLSP